MEKKKYFIYHEGLVEKSKYKMREVNGIDDIRRLVEEDSPIKGHYTNIHLDGDEDGSDLGFNTIHYVLADFEGYKNQCIGYANFK